MQYYNILKLNFPELLIYIEDEDTQDYFNELYN